MVERLTPQYRCVMPDLPLGWHRIPTKHVADLSLRALTLLVGQFLDHLDLADVTLVQNDCGGAQPRRDRRSGQAGQLNETVWYGDRDGLHAFDKAVARQGASPRC